MTRRAERIAAIQSLSAAERRWQPTPVDFLQMVQVGAPQPLSEFRALGAAVEWDGRFFVWVLLEQRGGAGGYAELARAAQGDPSYAEALRHGWQALHVMLGERLHAPSAAPQGA
jgi:hypothetical protein